MKKMMFVAALALAGLTMVGCAGSKADPVAEWKESRIMAEQIAAKQDVVLTLTDVTYQSTLTNPVLAAPINTFAIVPAAAYLKVVTSVDELYAKENGRRIYEGVMTNVKAGEDLAKILAGMPAEDKAAFDEYARWVKKADQDSVINTIVMPMINQIGAEAEKVADVLKNVKSLPEFALLTGFDLLSAGKALAADGDALAQQFSDTLAGANLWLVLLKRDKEAKAFGAEYDALIK